MSNKLRNRSKSVCIPRKQKLSENVQDSGDEESAETISFICNNTTIKTEKNEYTFSASETADLISQIKNQIPKNDSQKYSLRVEKLKWSQIQIAGRSESELKLFFKSLVNNTRTHKILPEIISEIESSLGSRETVVAKPIPVPTLLTIYVQDNLSKVKEKNPGLKHFQILKVLQTQFNGLSLKQQAKIQIKQEELKSQYLKQLEEYYAANPKEKPKMKRGTSSTPFDLYAAEKKEDGSTLNKPELLIEWNELPMDEKIPYIRESFEHQHADTKCISEKELKKLNTYFGKPKNYTTTYAYFIGEQTDLKMDGLTFGDRSKKLGAFWKGLNAKEKEEWNAKFLKYKNNYESSYAQYLKRVPTELVNLAENLTALPDTPFNLFHKNVRAKNPTTNSKDEWENLSRTKKVKWILKSFEIQETDGSKKLVSNDEMAILYKSLGKPVSYTSAYTLFRATHNDKSENLDTKWKNLTRVEKAELEDKCIQLSSDFEEHFTQYLLRLPEVCRKVEIANSKILSKAVDKQRMFLMVSSLSGNNQVDGIEEMFKDNIKKQRKRADDSQDEEQTSPKKKAKKSELVEEEAERPIKTKQSKKPVEEPMEEETEIPSKPPKKTKKPVEEPIEEETEKPKTKKGRKREPVEEEEKETPKKDRKSKQKEVSPVKVSPVKKIKVTEPIAPPKSAFKYFVAKVYKGKIEKAKEAWSKVSKDKKEEIKKLHAELNGAYLAQLKNYLQNLSQSEVTEYSKSKIALQESSDDNDSSSDDDDSSTEESE